MGVEYNSIGGLGIELNENQLVKLGFVPDDNDNIEKLIENAGLAQYYVQGGNFFTGDLKHYLLLKEKNFDECKKQVPAFLKRLKTAGIECCEKDLKLIHDFCIR